MAEVQAKDGVALVVHGDVVMVLWQGPARISRGAWLFERMEVATAPLQSFVVMQIILPSSSPPDKAMRELAAAWLKRFRAKTRVFVTVPIGDALWMNIVRTIMRAMFIIQGQATVQLIAETISAGVNKALDAKTKQTPSSDELLADARALFKALGEDPSRALREEPAAHA